MTPVVVVRNQEAAGQNRQGTNGSIQPSATRGARIQFTEHVGQGAFALSAICAGDGAYVRATGILGSLETETVAPQIQRPAPNFKSAQASRAVTAVVLSVISAPLRLFQLFPIVKAIGSLIPSLRVQPAKQSRGGFSKCLRSFSCAVFHDRNTTTGSDPRSWKTQPQTRMASKCLM